MQHSDITIPFNAFKKLSVPIKLSIAAAQPEFPQFYKIAIDVFKYIFTEDYLKLYAVQQDIEEYLDKFKVYKKDKGARVIPVRDIQIHTYLSRFKRSSNDSNSKVAFALLKFLYNTIDQIIEPLESDDIFKYHEKKLKVEEANRYMNTPLVRKIKKQCWLAYNVSLPLDLIEVCFYAKDVAEDINLRNLSKHDPDDMVLIEQFKRGDISIVLHNSYTCKLFALPINTYNRIITNI